MKKETYRGLLVAVTGLVVSFVHSVLPNVSHKPLFSSFSVFFGSWLLHSVMILITIGITYVGLRCNEYTFLPGRYATDLSRNIKISDYEATVYVCFTLIAASMVVLFFFGLGITAE